MKWSTSLKRLGTAALEDLDILATEIVKSSALVDCRLLTLKIV